ncbi:MAG: hypothetical protein AAGD15_13740 [Agrobacterium cavarae]|uniref:hypothetical protein n=1 Tax=Agrobacterium cavarae TaxID=2528239 RepID=UPI0031A51B97
MDTTECTFRKIGSRGLVIFERDGILMRRSIPPRDFSLGDINSIFVQMLQQLRQEDVRFGFISDTRGMTVGTHGTLEFLALTCILDDLLRVRKVVPDFWITWGILRQARGTRSGKADAHNIYRAIEWYGVEKKEVVLVCSTAEAQLAAVEAGITSIHYSTMKGGHHDQKIPELPFLPKIVAPCGLKDRKNAETKPASPDHGQKFNDCGPYHSPGADEA